MPQHVAGILADAAAAFRAVTTIEYIDLSEGGDLHDPCDEDRSRLAVLRDLVAEVGGILQDASSGDLPARLRVPAGLDARGAFARAFFGTGYHLPGTMHYQAFADAAAELCRRIAAALEGVDPARATISVTPGEKGEKGEKPSRPFSPFSPLSPPTFPKTRPRGRPRKRAGTDRHGRAYWWLDHVHLCPGGENGIAGIESLAAAEHAYEIMHREDFEVSLDDLRHEDRPQWWPDGPDGKPKQVVRFRDDQGKVSARSFADYVMRHVNAKARLQSDRKPRHTQHNVEVTTTPPSVTTPRRREAIETALEAVSNLADAATESDRLKNVRTIRSVMVGSLGYTEQAVEDLFAGGDLEAVACELDARFRTKKTGR